MRISVEIKRKTGKGFRVFEFDYFTNNSNGSLELVREGRKATTFVTVKLEELSAKSKKKIEKINRFYYTPKSTARF